MDRREFLAAVGSGVVLGVGGCASIPDPESPTPEGTTTEGGTTNETTDGGGTATANGTAENGGDGQPTVEMVTEGSDYYFDPIGLFVETGTTVRWVNESGAHSSTAYAEDVGAANVTRIPEGAESWDSGILSEGGAEFTHTFETAGTYDYFCTPHKTLGMVGRLVVGEPGGPATDGNPPDGDVPASDAIVEQGTIGWQEFTG